jgi:CelD/BcsL family acetyltransferase involved in cellulose biosynthesis
MALAVRAVTDLAGLEQLQSGWEKLTAAGAGDALFGSHLWNSCWWKHYQGLGELRAVVAEEGGELVGVWPLFLATRTFGEVELDMIGPRKMPAPGKGLRVRALAYLGSGEICSDYLQPVVEPARLEETLEAMLAHLTAARDWDLLDLCDMPAEWPGMPALKTALAKYVGAPRERFRYHAPYAPLGANYDEYLSTLSKKGRFNARKKPRQLQLNHKVEHVYHDDPATVREAMELFMRLHQERWNADGLPGVFVNERFVGFHHEIAARLLARGQLRLGFLRVNDAPVFATYSYQAADRLYMYQQGGSPDPRWNPYNLGYVALSYAIADAVGRGARVYDFLRGNAEYKLHWAKEARTLVQLQAARGARGKLFMLHSLINTDDKLRARVKSLLKRGSTSQPRAAVPQDADSSAGAE